MTMQSVGNNNGKAKLVDKDSDSFKRASNLWRYTSLEKFLNRINGVQEKLADIIAKQTQEKSEKEIITWLSNCRGSLLGSRVILNYNPAYGLFISNGYLVPSLSDEAAITTENNAKAKDKTIFGSIDRTETELKQSNKEDNLRKRIVLAVNNTRSVGLDGFLRNEAAQEAMRLSLQKTCGGQDDFVLKETVMGMVLSQISKMHGFAAYTLEELSDILSHTQEARQKLEQLQEAATVSDFTRLNSIIFGDKSLSIKDYLKKESTALLSALAEVEDHIYYTIKTLYEGGNKPAINKPVVNILLDKLITNGAIDDSAWELAKKALPKSMEKAVALLPAKPKMEQERMNYLLKARETQIEKYEHTKEDASKKINAFVEKEISQYEDFMLQDLKKRAEKGCEALKLQALQKSAKGNLSKKNITLSDGDNQAILNAGNEAIKGIGALLQKLDNEIAAFNKRFSEDWLAKSEAKIKEIDLKIAKESDKKMIEALKSERDDISVDWFAKFEAKIKEIDLKIAKASDEKMIEALKSERDDLSFQLSCPSLFQRSLFRYKLSEDLERLGQKLSGSDNREEKGKLSLEVNEINEMLKLLDKRIRFERFEEKASAYKAKSLHDINDNIENLSAVGFSRANIEYASGLTRQLTQDEVAKKEELERQKVILGEVDPNADREWAEHKRSLDAIRTDYRCLMNVHAKDVSRQMEELSKLSQKNVNLSDLKAKYFVSEPSEVTVKENSEVARYLSDAGISALYVNTAAEAKKTKKKFSSELSTDVEKALSKLSTYEELEHVFRMFVPLYIKHHYNNRAGESRKMVRWEHLDRIFDLQGIKGKEITSIKFNDEKIKKLALSSTGFTALLDAVRKSLVKDLNDETRVFASDLSTELVAIAVIVSSRYEGLLKGKLDEVLTRLKNATALAKLNQQNLLAMKSVVSGINGIANKLLQNTAADAVGNARVQEFLNGIISKSGSVLRVDGSEYAKSLIDAQKSLEKTNAKATSIDNLNRQGALISDNIALSDQALSSVKDGVADLKKTIDDEINKASGKSKEYIAALKKLSDSNIDYEKQYRSLQDLTGRMAQLIADPNSLSSNGAQKSIEELGKELEAAKKNLNEKRDILQSEQSAFNKVEEESKKLIDEKVVSALTAVKAKAEKIDVTNVESSLKDLNEAAKELKQKHNFVADIVKKSDEIIANANEKIKKLTDAVTDINEKASSAQDQMKQQQDNNAKAQVLQASLCNEVKKVDAGLDQAININNAIIYQCDKAPPISLTQDDANKLEAVKSAVEEHLDKVNDKSAKEKAGEIRELVKKYIAAPAQDGRNSIWADIEKAMSRARSNPFVKALRKLFGIKIKTTTTELYEKKLAEINKNALQAQAVSPHDSAANVKSTAGYSKIMASVKAPATNAKQGPHDLLYPMREDAKAGSKQNAAQPATDVDKTANPKSGFNNKVQQGQGIKMSSGGDAPVIANVDVIIPQTATLANH
jgi:hypothetical protein